MANDDSDDEIEPLTTQQKNAVAAILGVLLLIIR